MNGTTSVQEEAYSRADYMSIS